jgi:hypothetical protein
MIFKSRLKPESEIETVLKENIELISIFVASIKTAKKNKIKKVNDEF